MQTIYLIIGTIDVGLILLIGLIAAIMVLFGKDTKMLTERVVPAAAILIGTSIAAGIAMAVVRWMIGT